MRTYSLTECDALRTALTKLLNDGPYNNEYGVCYNLGSALRCLGVHSGKIDAYAFVAAEAVHWPHALRKENGNIEDYFVRYTLCLGLWEGANGTRRKNLIRFLLQCVDRHEA